LAAFYGRFSSKNQSETSVEDQLRLSREKIEQTGFRLPADLEYSDHAVSDTKLRRVGLDQLLESAKAKRFDLIVVYSLSRLGRESVITMPILKMLVMEYEIRFISVAESFDSQSSDWITLATLYTLQHENYVKELSKNVHRGQEGAILDGLSVGDHRFGYQSVPSPNGEARGRGRNAKPKMVYQIHPEQAEWVQQIFAWYVAERCTISWITRELNRRNAPKDHRATTSHWTPALVAGVLACRKYIGEWSWGLKRNKRPPSTGQLTQLTRPESETRKWLRQRPDLRLVSDEVFFAAQELRRKQIAQAVGSRAAKGQLRGYLAGRNSSHLLAGLFKCQSCGRMFHTAGAKGNYMACSGYKYKICNCKTMVPRQLAQALILDVVSTTIKSNSAWLQQIVDFTKAKIQAVAKQNPSRLNSVTQQLNALDQKIERLIDRIETTDDPGIEARLAQRRKEKEGLQRELQELQRQQADIPTIPTAEWVEQQLGRLDRVLRSGTPAATYALHNLLDGPIILQEIPHADRQRCHFRGTLRIRIGLLSVERGPEIPQV
jgi:site-specific DNA recombinase